LVPSSRVVELKNNCTNIYNISRRAKGFGHYVVQLSDRVIGESINAIITGYLL
jgi:hypothetical protein